MRHTDRQSVSHDAESSDEDGERMTNNRDGRFTGARAQRLMKRSRVAMHDLPLYLEKVTARGLRVIDKILMLPLDAENGPLIRAQVTAALGVVSSQLRADEARLKRKATGDALARLLKVIEQERALLENRRSNAQKASHHNHSEEHGRYGKNNEDWQESLHGCSSMPVSAKDTDSADLVNESTIGTIERVSLPVEGE